MGIGDRVTALGVMAMLLVATGEPAFAGNPGPPAILQHVDLESDTGNASLTLLLSAPVRAHVFRLHAPERIVVDLPHTRTSGPLPGPTAGGSVTTLRSGFTPQHALRLVLELNSPMRLQQQVIKSAAWQLRIDLQATGLAAAPRHAPAPAASVADTDARPARAAARLAVTSAVPTSVRALHAPSGAERPVVIAVDAGHGGDDPGATGQGGTREKDVTLAIARALAARIEREPGMHAVLTRNGDYFVDLVERRRRAQQAHADMFVSIHADAIRDREVSGASIYILSDRGASSQAAKILAEEQNAADLKGGISLAAQKPDLRPVLLDLSQNASMGESSEAADRVLNALDGVGAIRKHEVQQAAFVVLKSPDIPSMLIETAYISNPAEERMLRTPARQERLADAICAGISGYFHKFPPEGTLYVRARERDGAMTEPLARDGG